MGSLILCHKKRARRPYEIHRVHMHIYTIEELCYYLCNNLYLIDQTIMNRRLCDWIDDELEMTDLAEELRVELDQNVALEEFVLTVLRGSIIYAPSEITKIQNLLMHLQNQKEVEKSKYKADNLFQTREYASAIQIYQSIVNSEWDDSVEKSFYGQVYACLGASYGNLFLYPEAAGMYEKAYDICKDPDILKSYLYACFKAYPQQEYVKMLSGNSIYLAMDALLKEDLDQAKKGLNLDVQPEQLAEWKKEYRKIDKNERI